MSKYNVAATGEAFIVPNRASKIDFQWCYRPEMYINASMDNGLTEEQAKEEKYFELWLLSKDLHTENLCDHGFRFTTPDGVKHYGSGCRGFFPVSLFAGKKEGDTVDLILTGQSWCKNPSPENEDDIVKENEEVELRLKVTLSQSKYRYRSFGTFEQVLERICY